MTQSDQPGGEAGAIASTSAPLTVDDLATGLIAAGVERGGTVIVHSSLSKLGWVVGGAHAMVLALLDAIGDEGTIVMPAQTGISDPANWQNPPVPESWWPTIRGQMPAFDPLLTPLRAMGAVVECFRRLPGVIYSGHPAVGFLARGPKASSIVGSHPLEESLGDPSPLGRLYDADALIVLIGVGHGNNTSLHLAEHRAEYAGKTIRTDGAPLVVDGVRRWVTYTDLDHDEDDFVALGEAFIASGGIERRSSVGRSEIVTYRMRAIVDYGVDWMREYRTVAAQAPT